MPGYIFSREVRTPSSECYTVIDFDTGNSMGRLDLHMTAEIIHCSLFLLREEVGKNEIESLVEDMESFLLTAVGIEGEELLVHVHMGKDLGVYSTDDEPPQNGKNA